MGKTLFPSDKLLQKIFFIGDDGQLYRKAMDTKIYNNVDVWNRLAKNAQPINSERINLMTFGLNKNYKTAFICNAVKHGIAVAIEQHEAKKKQPVEFTVSKKPAKPKKPRKVTYINFLEKLGKGAEATKKKSTVAMALNTVKPTIPPKPKPTLQQLHQQAKQQTGMVQYGSVTLPAKIAHYLNALNSGQYQT